MTTAKFFIPLLSFVLACSTKAFSEDCPRVTILSYNIHHAEGMDRELNLKRIAAVIRRAEPDIVLLQEVDQKVKRSAIVDQPEQLSQLTEMEAVFGVNIPLQGGHYGNVILSRFPILEEKNHHLPNFADGEQRGVLEAVIQLPHEREQIRVFATHLDHRHEDRERIASAEVLNKLAKAHPEQLQILGGDFNALPKSETLDILQSEWTLSNDSPLGTVPVNQPKRQIDYICYRPQNRWRVVEVKVIAEKIASDHRPILATLELLSAQ